MSVPTEAEVAAIARQVLQTEGVELFRSMLRAELSNGWGEHRRLVEQELRRGAKERLANQDSIRALEKISERQTTTSENLTALLAEQRKSDAEQLERITSLRIEFAKSSAMWGGGVALVVALLSAVVGPLLKTLLGGTP